MKLTKIVDYSQYENILIEYRHTETKSNDYLQAEAASLITEGLLFEYKEGDNVFLFVAKENFFRMYYYLNDLSAIVSFPDIELVAEILFRGNENTIDSEIAYLEKCGFRKNVIRDQYVGLYQDFEKPIFNDKVVILEASTIEEVKWACELFNSSFDKWSGDYIPSTQYPTLMQNQDIIIAKDLNGNLLGATQRELRKGYVHWAHLAVIPSARGLGVGTSLMDALIERNHSDEKTRYMMWVQRQNATAVKIYVRKGFKPLNKSTISLIKQ